MLSKLTNKSEAPWIVHDHRGKAHAMAPGASVTVELNEATRNNYHDLKRRGVVDFEIEDVTVQRKPVEQPKLARPPNPQPHHRMPQQEPPAKAQDTGMSDTRRTAQVSPAKALLDEADALPFAKFKVRAKEILGDKMPKGAAVRKSAIVAQLRAHKG
jgi:hypothetical protein